MICYINVPARRAAGKKHAMISVPACYLKDRSDLLRSDSEATNSFILQRYAVVVAVG